MADLNVHQLNYFVEAARCGSMSAACNKLGVTEQALSKSIRKLEEQLGRDVFLRTPTGLALTPFGRFFLKRAKVAVEAVRLADASPSDYDASRRRVVAMGMPAYCFADHGGSLHPAELARIQQLFDDVEFSFLELPVSAIEKGLRDGGLQFGIGYEMPSDEFVSVELGGYPLSAVLHKASPLACKHEVRVDEIASYKQALAGNDEAALSFLRRTLGADARISPFHFDATDPADLIVDERTVMVLPEQHARRTASPDRVVVKPLVDTTGRRIETSLSICWKRTLRLGDAERALLHLVGEAYEKPLDPDGFPFEGRRA